jgi:hypothetical protein
MQWFSGKRHAGKLARVVWEGGNGKGLEDTSPVPYFIRRGEVGKGPAMVPRRPLTLLRISALKNAPQMTLSRPSSLP